MSENIELLFNSVKDDMKANFENLSNQIEKLKDSIEHYQEKTNDSSACIQVINEKISTLDKRLTDNFLQHKEFYDNFDNLNKFVYKLTGGIILAGGSIVTLLKLVGAI